MRIIRILLLFSFLHILKNKIAEYLFDASFDSVYLYNLGYINLAKPMLMLSNYCFIYMFTI